MKSWLNILLIFCLAGSTTAFSVHAHAETKVLSYEEYGRIAMRKTMEKYPDTGLPEVLGVVGNQYTPVQNEEHVDLLNTLVDQSGAHFETAGALKGGRETFVTMKVPNNLTVGGIDPVDLYISALNSHDGSSAFRFIVTPVRIVCANTQAAALSQAKSRFSIRHTRNGSAGIMQTAREALGIAFKYMDEFDVAAERMIQETLTEAAFADIVARLYPVEPGATVRARQTVARHRDAIMTLAAESDTLTEVRGTRWAGYQAVTEYLDHYVPLTGYQGDALKDARAMLQVNGTTDERKSRAFAMLQMA